MGSARHLDVAPAQAGFDRDRNCHGRGNGVHNSGRQFGLKNQAAAAAFAGDFAHRAAHVDVDQKGAGCFGAAGGLGHGRRTVVKELHPDRAVLRGQRVDLEPAVAKLQAGGVDHFGEQQGVGGPAPHQAPKDLVAHSRQWRLQHPAVQGARCAPPSQLQRCRQAGRMGCGEARHGRC